MRLTSQVQNGVQMLLLMSESRYVDVMADIVSSVLSLFTRYDIVLKLINGLNTLQIKNKTYLKRQCY